MDPYKKYKRTQTETFESSVDATHKPESSPAQDRPWFMALWSSSLTAQHRPPPCPLHLEHAGPLPPAGLSPSCSLCLKGSRPGLCSLPSPTAALCCRPPPKRATPTPIACHLLLQSYFLGTFHCGTNITCSSPGLCSPPPPLDTSFGRGSPGQHGSWDRAWHTVDAQ